MDTLQTHLSVLCIYTLDLLASASSSGLLASSSVEYMSTEESSRVDELSIDEPSIDEPSLSELYPFAGTFHSWLVRGACMHT